jgi:hypothetical protein
MAEEMNALRQAVTGSSLTALFELAAIPIAVIADDDRVNGGRFIPKPCESLD